MLLVDFLCFWILASYFPITGVSGIGHGPRLGYSHRDGEQEELQNGTVSVEIEMPKAVYQKHNSQTSFRSHCMKQ